VILSVFTIFYFLDGDESYLIVVLEVLKPLFIQDYILYQRNQEINEEFVQKFDAATGSYNLADHKYVDVDHSECKE
jgi:hypothetical protein